MVVVLQHTAPEGPGLLGERLVARGHTLRTVRTDLGEPIPTEIDGPLVVMGGPMGVYQADRHPHLIAELRLIEHAVTNDLPIFGICLGSQLLAAALGANVRPQGTQEIGWKPVWRSDASDAVFGTLPDEISPLHWHGDVFDLPPGAVALARSEMTPLQAFRHGRHRYGVLFHLEVRAAELAGMAQAFPEELALGGPVLEEAPARLAHLRPLAERAFDAWIDSWSPADHLARSAPR